MNPDRLDLARGRGRTVRWALLSLVLVGASCNTWQGTHSDRSSDWTWVCGGDDDDDGTPAPDSGCPKIDAATADDVDGGA